MKYIVSLYSRILLFLFPDKVAAKNKKRKVSFWRWFTNHLISTVAIAPERSMSLFLSFNDVPFHNRLRRMSRLETGARSYFILMSMPTVTQVIIAVMKEPRRWGDKGTFALARLNACTSNVLIPIPMATMVIYQADLVLFNTAQSDMASGKHTAKEIRDKAWALVKNHLLACMAVAQANSNATPLMGIEIIQSGLFGVKQVGLHGLDIFTATNVGPGQMYLKAPAEARGTVYDFEISLDGITWTAYLSIHDRFMTATGLTPVTKVWFRTRARIIGLPIPVWTLLYVTVI